MEPMKAFTVLVLCAAFVMGSLSLGTAGQDTRRAVTPYEGQIRSVKIDKCGMQPGTCEGSIVLAKQGGGEVALSIKPGTWIKRGTNLVTIDELGVGNYIQVQAIEVPGDPIPRAWYIDQGEG